VDTISSYEEGRSFNRPVFELPCHVIFSFREDVVEPFVEIDRDRLSLYCAQKFFENSIAIYTEGAESTVLYIAVFDCLKNPPAICILEIDAIEIVSPPLQRIIDTQLV
jgi:hypothetical protein